MVCCVPPPHTHRCLSFCPVSDTSEVAQQAKAPIAAVLRAGVGMCSALCGGGNRTVRDCIPNLWTSVARCQLKRLLTLAWRVLPCF